ncbi:MAG TPA: EscU/YscU/HrcU family type III secretion system export apparatus switch protein [Polyangiaceae bacterium]|nr:EscU/YscU/HrcU family type III secretion system export apparatus switch protein [Polyangiaceae bacterium]
MSSQHGEKQFDPTPHRREEFRKQGRFARARDAAGVAATMAVVGALLGSRAAIGKAIDRLFSASYGDLGALAHGKPGDAFRFAGEALVTIAGPASIAACVAASVAGLAQTGLRLNLDAVGFKAQRLDPIARLRQIASPKQAVVEMLMSILRVGVVGYVAYRAALIEVPGLLELARTSVDVAIPRLVDAAVHIVLNAGGVLAVISVIDYAQSRFRLAQEMKMTRQEFMEDMRQNEGDPKIKARMKARARALAKKRALQNVKKADVIVTNPTHVAVALRYDVRDPAPVVLAKGHDDVALRIRAEARKFGIPILENRKLARALDAEVPVGHAIPVAHFAAVARVLAFVFRLRGGRRRGTRRA